MVYLPTSTIKTNQEWTPGFLHFEKGNSYKPSFITVTGRVQNPKYIYHPRENPKGDHQQIPILENNQGSLYDTNQNNARFGGEIPEKHHKFVLLESHQMGGIL